MSSRLLVLALFPALLPAQVHLTTRTGFVAHGPHAVDKTASDEPSFRPGTAGELALVLGIDRGEWRVAVFLRRAPADLILRGAEAGVITPDALRATGLGLEVGHLLAGRLGQPSLHLLLVLERTNWSFPLLNEPARHGWGGGAALEGAVPLGGRFAGILRLDGARTGSLFSEDELPQGYQRQPATRMGLSLGLRWGSR
jgi:hypothetical protein